jgi:sulfur carrier protein ThiS
VISTTLFSTQGLGVSIMRIRLEIWLRLGKDLGKDFQRLSDTCYVLEEETGDGVTVRNFFGCLADKEQLIQEKIFKSGEDIFYPEVVVTLNDLIISPEELYERILKDGDKITVLPMFAGG